MPSGRQILFSERNGYANSREVIIIEDVPQEVSIAISSALIRLMQSMDDRNIGVFTSQADELGKFIWTHLMGRSLVAYNISFEEGRKLIADWIQSRETEWFRKLDLIEFVLAKVGFIYQKQFIAEITEQFEYLGFGYRILNGHVVNIVSEPELKAVSEAIDNNIKIISRHIEKALELHTRRPKGDYVNSIKESISAVEAMARHYTGELKFKDAINTLKKKGLHIHPIMESVMIKLYAYTNQPNTGIRHPLMEPDSEYIPSSAESLYMLISCSALVNYVRAKKAVIAREK